MTECPMCHNEFDGGKPCECGIEWHSNHHVDSFLVFAVPCIAVFTAILTSIDPHQILILVFFISLMIFVTAIGMLLMYNDYPVLVGIGEDRIVIKHRFRFRGERLNDVPWRDIQKLSFFKTGRKGGKVMFTPERTVALLIPDDVAARIMYLWRKEKTNAA